MQGLNKFTLEKKVLVMPNDVVKWSQKFVPTTPID